jgi:hypothetical protein
MQINAVAISEASSHRCTRKGNTACKTLTQRSCGNWLAATANSPSALEIRRFGKPGCGCPKIWIEKRTGSKQGMGCVTGRCLSAQRRHREVSDDETSFERNSFGGDPRAIYPGRSASAGIPGSAIPTRTINIGSGGGANASRARHAFGSTASLLIRRNRPKFDRRTGPGGNAAAS